MKEDYKRHNLSDKAWAVIEPLLPGRSGTRSRPAKDNRLFINAVIWGFYVPELRGEIYLLNTVIGKTLIAAFVVGETKEFGKKFLKRSRKIQILNGL